MVYKCISWYIMVYNGILYVSNTFKYSTPILWDPNSCIVRNILMFIWGDWMLGGGIRKHSKLDFGIWGTYTVSSYIIIKKEEISLEPKSNECITNSIQKQLLHTPLGMFLSMDWIQRSTEPSPWCGPSIAPTPGISMDSMPSLVRKSMTLGM